MYVRVTAHWYCCVIFPALSLVWAARSILIDCPWRAAPLSSQCQPVCIREREKLRKISAALAVSFPHTSAGRLPDIGLQQRGGLDYFKLRIRIHRREQERDTEEMLVVLLSVLKLVMNNNNKKTTWAIFFRQEERELRGKFASLSLQTSWKVFYQMAVMGLNMRRYNSISLKKMQSSCICLYPILKCIAFWRLLGCMLTVIATTS